MTEAAPDHTGADHFAAARFAARAEGLSPPEVIRLEHLLQALAVRGITADDPRVPRYTAPLVERSRARDGQVLRPEALGPGAPPIVPPSDPGNDPRATRGRRLALRCLALPLCFLLASDAPPPPPPQAAATVAVRQLPTVLPTDQPPPPPPPATKPRTREEIHYPGLYWLLVLLISCSIAAALARPLAHVLARRRMRRLRRESERDNSVIARLAVRQARVLLFQGSALVPALRKLRRYRVLPSGQMDAAASIRATIAAGGRADIRYGKRRLSPEYLLLGEREHPQDHLAPVAQAWQARLSGAGIASMHYDFFGDPGSVRSVAAGPEADAEPLDAILARHEGAQVMVLMEGFDAVSGTRPAPDWVARLSDVARPHLMNPRGPAQWSAPEMRLEALGVDSFAADPEGVASFAERIDRGESPESGSHEENTRNPPRKQADLAEYLADHRDMLLSPIPPEPAAVSALMHNLETWLDKDAFDWLCALSLLPVINSGFTAFAGLALKDHAIMSHARYLSIARLPWLRAATMPDWVRQALAEAMSPFMRSRAAATVAAWLDPPKGAPVDPTSLVELRRAAEGKAYRKRLASRLEGGRHPVFADSLLVGTLRGKAPGETGVALTGEASEPSQAWWLRIEALAILTALVLVAITVARNLDQAKYARLPTVLGFTIPEPPIGPSFIEIVQLPPEPDNSAKPQPPSPNALPVAPQPAAEVPQVPVVTGKAGKTTDEEAVSGKPGKAAVTDKAPVATGNVLKLYVERSDNSFEQSKDALIAALNGVTVDGRVIVAQPATYTKAQNAGTSIYCETKIECGYAEKIAALIEGFGVGVGVTRVPGFRSAESGTLRVMLQFGAADVYDIDAAYQSGSFGTGSAASGGSVEQTQVQQQSLQPQSVSVSISRAGLDLIERYEGDFAPRPYRASDAGDFTPQSSLSGQVGQFYIGYGHRLSDAERKAQTVSIEGRPVDFNKGLTAAQAEQLLIDDLTPVYAKIDSLVTVALSASQRDALASFQWNTGALERSTLLKQLNAGDYAAVPRELRRWSTAQGKQFPGLAARREAEIALWNADSISDQQSTATKD